MMVMTTEVYRNMAWRARSASGSSADEYMYTDTSADLTDNSIVVLDEFHYMGEKGRGSTWEESVIFSPAATQIVG